MTDQLASDSARLAPELSEAPQTILIADDDDGNLPDGDPAWWLAYHQRLEEIAAEFGAT